MNQNIEKSPENQPRWNEGKVTVYKFDIFKGVVDSDGKVQKIKSIGKAYLREGLRTYTVHLKTFLEVTFYLLQNTRTPTPDFVILSREKSKRPERKYHCNNIGEGNALNGVNADLMRLEWDLFGDDIYLKLEPETRQEMENEIQSAA
jgi:hypothetical protein